MRFAAFVLIAGLALGPVLTLAAERYDPKLEAAVNSDFRPATDKARMQRTRSKTPRRSFFAQPAIPLCRELLGTIMTRRIDGALRRARIVEVEAYLGPKDLASHSSKGRTARTEVMFGPPGHAYVYFIYGNHYCLNVSCMPEGVGEGVLFRAMEPVFGLESMALARGLELPVPARTAQLRLLSSGPGRMSEALGITRVRDNNKDLTSSRSDLWFADDGYRPERIAATPRIGIKKAVEQPLRFVIAGNSFVSAKRVE